MNAPAIVQPNNALPPGIEKLMGEYEKLIKKQELQIRSLVNALRDSLLDDTARHWNDCGCRQCEILDLLEETELSQ